ncbi:MAG: hypothetical protein ACRBBW_13155 [Cellvibrionaceae bacterium]
MANTNAPSGLQPFRHLTGGQVRSNEYSIASGYNTALYAGDVVEMTGTGKNVKQAAAGNVDNIGVFAGCRYVNELGEQKFSQYWPASTVATEIVAYVYDDPNIVFQAQCNTLSAGDVGQLVDWEVAAGVPAIGKSATIVDVATGTAAAGMALRIVELKPEVTNEYGANAKALVIFAEHALKTGAVGAGGS